MITCMSGCKNRSPSENHVALQGQEIYVCKQLADLSQKINADVSPGYTSRKVKDEIKAREDKLSLVWPVWCRLCWLHVPTLIPTHWRTQRIRDQKPPQRAAWYGARRHPKEFSNLNKVSEQIWLSYFWNVLLSRTETNAKQSVWFNSHQTICLEQFLLWLFYFFHCIF